MIKTSLPSRDEFAREDKTINNLKADNVAKFS